MAATQPPPNRAGSILIGGLGPLTAPGIAWAGRELLAGMEIAIDDVNAGGGIGGRRLEFAFEDTRGVPEAGVDALERLRSAGACAVVGEFHSVVADALVVHADRLGIPFLCSSAVLDAITARRSPWVFRLAPPQSQGWTLYADFIAAHGFRQVIEIIHEDVYWTSGADVIRRRLASAGVRVARIPVTSENWAPAIAEQVAELAAGTSPSIALLLVAYPQPLAAIIKAFTDRGVLGAHLALGDPAGRAVFPDWSETTGDAGASASYLSYQLPGELTSTGRAIEAVFSERHHRHPSFVALEGYDAILVLADALERAANLTAEVLATALAAVEVPGTRGVIRFTSEPGGVVHNQWASSPLCVVARGAPGRRLSEAQVLWPR